MKKKDKKIELTEADIRDLKLNLCEMEERCDDLNTSIKALYNWLERMEFKFKKKFKIIKIDEFRQL